MKGVIIIVKTITLRLEEELHKELKLKTIQDGTTIQNYITELIKKDLKKK
jgi:predicted DNA binding CopG/RHH family protein